ncbi:MAG: hypothetical protein ACM3QX_18205 [Syntrophomonadaceae bacterium]
MLQQVKDFLVTVLKSKKSLLVGMIVRWLLKIVGGVFLSFGVSQGDAEITLASIAAIVVGIVISLLESGKLAFLSPDEFKK